MKCEKAAGKRKYKTCPMENEVEESTSLGRATDPKKRSSKFGDWYASEDSFSDNPQVERQGM